MQPPYYTVAEQNFDVILESSWKTYQKLSIGQFRLNKISHQSKVREARWHALKSTKPKNR